MQKLVVILSLLTAASASAAVPPLDSLEVERSGNDLVLTWAPSGAPVDGYRVYLATDVRCEQQNLVYEGATPSYTHGDAMLEPGLGLYRVAAFEAAEEGPLTVPVYRYRLGMAAGFNSVSLAYHPGPLTALEMCQDLRPDEPQEVTMAWRAGPERHLCGHVLTDFDLAVGAGLVLDHLLADPEGVLWGRGDADWLLELPLGTRLVSLPYDHAYVDLMQIAVELPAATGLFVDTGLAETVGLERLSPGEPWSGTNVVLDSRRGTGLWVTLESSTDWKPRRLCAECPVPLRRVEPLLAVKAGDDVAVQWKPSLQSTGGYDVHRVDDKTALPPDVINDPPLLSVAGAEPALPVTDAGAVSLASDFYYQTVGLCPDGTPGEL